MSDYESVFAGLTRLCELKRELAGGTHERVMLVRALGQQGVSIADLERATGLAPDIIKRMIA